MKKKEMVTEVVIDKSSQLYKIADKILDNLPPLEIKEFKPIDPRRTLLCLQAEYGTFKAQELPQQDNPIEYIGTVKLFTCLFICIYNDQGEYFFAHLDGQENIDFKPPIEEFKNREHLKALILGGDGSSPNYKISSPIFINIIQQLIQLAKHFDLTISVVGQKVLTHNVKKNIIEQTQLNYNRIIAGAQILFTYLYNEPLNLDWVNETLSPVDFKKESPSKVDIKMFHFLGLIVKSNGIKDDILDIGLLKLPELSPVGKDIFAKETCKKTFYQYLAFIISSMGEKSLNAMQAAVLFVSHTAAQNFAFNIKTHEFYYIPAFTPTYLRALREVRIWDANIPRNFQFYSVNRYLPCELSDQFINFSKKIQAENKELKVLNVSTMQLPKISGEFPGRAARDVLLYLQSQRFLESGPEIMPEAQFHRKQLENKICMFFRSPTEPNRLMVQGPAQLIAEYASEDEPITKP